MTIRFKKRLASVSVRLEDKVVYLAGSSDDEPEEATPETAPHSKALLSQGSLLRGTVCIKVTSSCSFRHLRVVLVGVLRTFAFAKTGPEDNGLAAQSHINLRHEVNVLDERSPHFQPGVHE